MSELERSVDERYSSEGADGVDWRYAQQLVEDAGIYWLSSVRPDGRPHVTPLIAVWSDGALWFCTGADERKGRNLEANASVVVTTGRNEYEAGVDVVLEGEARRVTDHARLEAIAKAYVDKYGPDWAFQVEDGGFRQEGQESSAVVFAVTPSTVFTFERGAEVFSQTRFRFPS